MNNFPDFSSHGYDVEKELGSNRAGGRITYLAAAAHLVTAAKTCKQVVIKQFQFAKSSSSWADYELYNQEIQILKGLDHPGVPRYLDCFQTADGFCMVQEYKNALSLGTPRSFSADAIRQIAVSMLEILVYLQNRIPPLIHRDIKPENILVDDQINVYLVDFGLARIGDGEVGVSSVVKGTLGFMPPEQLFNRQLTEASDLYGLGMTIICLLTGTKSDQIGNLVDISYQVNFKHLAPKLNPQWVNWLNKMVEPKLKERYPNAAAALKAIPATSVRPPEAQLSQSNLEFAAAKPRERLTQTITINNLIPETVLEGVWEVAPHPHDPPHTPDSHAWISFQPARFSSNQIECQVTVDTRQLMARKTYSRRVLLHTNTLSKTYSLTVQVRTAPAPVKVQDLPYGLLVLLCLFAAALTAVISWVAVVAGTLVGTPAAAGFGTAVGVAVGLEAAAWMMGIAGARLGAIAGATAGVGIGVFVLIAAVAGYVSSVGVAALVSGGAGFLGGVILGTGTGIAIETLAGKGMSAGFAVVLCLITAASGVSLGFGFILGFMQPLIVTAIVCTNLSLLMMLLRLPLKRIKLLNEHRNAERRLIKP